MPEIQEVPKKTRDLEGKTPEAASEPLETKAQDEPSQTDEKEDLTPTEGQEDEEQPASDHLKEYRTYLVQAEQKAQADFDKTVLSLSGGALGISFAFLKNVVGAGPHSAVISLYCAWASWGLSVSAILLSFYLSQHSLRKAIGQVDSGRIENEKPGGAFATATSVCNALGGILFILGVLLMILFVIANLEV